MKMTAVAAKATFKCKSATSIRSSPHCKWSAPHVVERGQDIVCTLISNVSLNIHSLQLTLAFIPVAQSRTSLKEERTGLFPASAFSYRWSVRGNSLYKGVMMTSLKVNTNTEGRRLKGFFIFGLLEPYLSIKGYNHLLVIKECINFQKE